MPIPSSSLDTLLYLSTVVACHCRRVRARHNLVQLSELILKMRVAEHSGPTCLCSKGSCKLCSSRPACLVLARFMKAAFTRDAAYTHAAAYVLPFVCSTERLATTLNLLYSYIKAPPRDFLFLLLLDL